MIEDASGGQVTAEIKYGLAPPPAMMDLVQDGAADITWIFHGYQPGRFVATQLIELPGYVGDAEAASVAYWRVHQAYLAKLDEHRGVKLIGLMTHGPAQLHSDADVENIGQIEGMKLRLPGGVGSLMGEALGGIGIQVPAPKVYETLASKAADGVLMPMESRAGFKLTEVAKNVFEVPGGVYRGSFAIIMNQDAFDALPAELQAKLDSEVFGETLSRVAGQVWDAIDAEGRAVTLAAEGNAIHEASADDMAAFNKVADGVKAKVLGDIAALGVDVAAAQAMIQAEMDKN
jgi:TRAP-type C4-dicarboxylate transport system substrate-binding protein